MVGRLRRPHRLHLPLGELRHVESRDPARQAQQQADPRLGNPRREDARVVGHHNRVLLHPGFHPLDSRPARLHPLHLRCVIEFRRAHVPVHHLSSGQQFPELFPALRNHDFHFRLRGRSLNRADFLRLELVHRDDANRPVLPLHPLHPHTCRRCCPSHCDESPSRKVVF